MKMIFTCFADADGALRPALAGSGPVFADWQRFLPLEPAGDGTCRWRLEVDVPGPFEYKFVLLDESGAVRSWEEGFNQVWPTPGTDPGAARTWHVTRIPRFQGQAPLRMAGVAVPVFSLRSRAGFGIGEFADLKPLSDWAARSGLRVVQVLPVNDTSATFTRADSYPYSAVSAFALHPFYIHLQDLFPSGALPPEAEAVRASLEALPAVDYEQVAREKMRLLRAAYAVAGEETLSRPDFQRFLAQNASWLRPYAAFCLLRDRFGTADFTRWEDFSTYDAERVSALLEEDAAGAGFHYYVQYHLDRQLRDAVRYAHRQGVLLKGDLPIGVGRFSADAWQYPALFHRAFQAGAPPDYFSADGQTWGFPTYNWEAMAADGYAWWRARLKQMERYFDLFRIDHILGFFRIWEADAGVASARAGHFYPALPYTAEDLALRGLAPDGGPEGLFVEDPRQRGCYHPRIDARSRAAYRELPDSVRASFDALYDDFFYHRHDAFWREGALRKLPALLGSTSMLPCGEDLGMVPDCVGGVMRQEHILSLEIQRMPKAFGQAFGDPGSYPYESVCATGSHDTSTLRGWWEEEADRCAQYWREVLGQDGPAPAHLPPEVAREIVRRHLGAPSALCILPIQDTWAMDRDLWPGGDPAAERINNPADPHHYWRWRMHVPLEDLSGDGNFCAMLQALVRAGGR